MRQLAKLRKTVHVTFCDINPRMIQAWSAKHIKFAEKLFPEISFRLYEGDIFKLSADALVSPANSFGFMDGGIDAAYAKFFGPVAQQELQMVIQKGFNWGEMLVGNGACLYLGNEKFPYLICVPTMRTPATNLNGTINAYLATRSAMALVNQRNLDSVVFPGMGTGSGELKEHVAAYQMFMAVEHAIKGVPFPSTWREAYALQRSLANGGP